MSSKHCHSTTFRYNRAAVAQSNAQTFRLHHSSWTDKAGHRQLQLYFSVYSILLVFWCRRILKKPNSLIVSCEMSMIGNAEICARWSTEVLGRICQQLASASDTTLHRINFPDVHEQCCATQCTSLQCSGGNRCDTRERLKLHKCCSKHMIPICAVLLRNTTPERTASTRPGKHMQQIIHRLQYCTFTLYPLNVHLSV